MNKFLLLAIACMLGATACSQALREPTDAQLGALLRVENADPADANAALDGLAIECLRAWSQDKDLQKDLPVRTAGEDGRKACRARLDGWIADAGRNPDKFSFADVSAPETVRRAVELQRARRTAAMAAAKQEAAIPTNPLSRPMAAAQPEDLAFQSREAENAVQEAETLCQQTQGAARAPGANPRLVLYAKFCERNAGGMRKTMEGMVKSGNASALKGMVKNANIKSNAAREVLALPPVKG
ncbi:hypothetical protein [Dokdonella sp.]|uniref:hypothetical protein n=1 Tax=Dokdonella sp. TaxID=2291710 RepID=UPI001B0609FD|nr:hypothetical protein [Dokdonella sp.]MBO9661351.1 hypothetical protein [Dokdonella sp.]